jgi:hypothetical protein
MTKIYDCDVIDTLFQTNRTRTRTRETESTKQKAARRDGKTDLIRKNYTQQTTWRTKK